MAGTTYNTLNLATVDEEPKATSVPRVGAVASVIAAVCVMFFAGRVHQGQTALYTHDEVLDVAATCADNQFIGGCTECTECETFEYVNGGCTFFKDTFCSYCEPIANCQRTNTACSTSKDSSCTECDCTVPVAAWEHPSASCFFGTSCVACDICEKGQFQIETCSQEVDTQCQKCKTCKEGEYVKEPCSYSSDTVCEACVDCVIGDQQTLTNLCTGHADDNQNDIFSAGSQTQCKTCTVTTDDQDTYVESACTKDVDTVISSCSLCEDGYYVDSEYGCGVSGGIYNTETANRVCAECTELLEGGGLAGGPDAPLYVKTLCDKTKTEDFAGQECLVCEANQYIDVPCALGTKDQLGVDTECRLCELITNCDTNDLRCGATDALSTCSGCETPTFGNCCNTVTDNGFTSKNLGLKCGWQHTGGNCEANDQSFREREALRNGFNMDGSNEDFILWCKRQCESFEECTAFEVKACLVSGDCGDDSVVKDDSVCSLKNQPDTGDSHKNTDSWDDSKNCFSRPSNV